MAKNVATFSLLQHFATNASDCRGITIKAGGIYSCIHGLAAVGRLSVPSFSSYLSCAVWLNLKLLKQSK